MKKFPSSTRPEADEASSVRFFPHVFLAAVVWGSVSCGGHHDAPLIEALPPVEVTTQVIEAHQTPVFEEVVGTVRPRKEAQVAAKVTGRVLELSAVPGMRVTKGQVLARLDVGELDAALDRAKAALAQADRDLARFRTLKESGAVALSEFEQTESRRQMALATVEETKAMVANATVTAPFDGTVTRKFLEPGDLASPARALFSMEDASLLRLEINLAESLAGGLAIGDRFRVKVAGAEVDLEGVVSEIAPSADVGSRTFSIKLDLPDQDALRAGQFGRAYVPRGNRTALMVPAAALISRGQMDYLFVAAEGIARLQIVRTGEVSDSEIEILAGLDGGESIILNPPTELRDGQALAGN